MFILGSSKKNTPTLPKSNLSVVLDAIPQETLDLLWILDGEKRNSDKFNEPSAISINYVIDSSGANNEMGKLDYYPNYRSLTPQQKFAYLNWLRDVTEAIDIGYVFIFYYGLERHLLHGKFHEAFNMIMKLREHHKNNSFQAYSLDALVLASMYHQEYDILKEIDIEELSSNTEILLFGLANGMFSARQLMDMCRRFGFTNTRYIKNKTELFERELRNLFYEKYNMMYFPLSKDVFLNIEKTYSLALANISLEQRVMDAPDILSSKELCKIVCELLNEAHQRVKKIK